MEFMVWINVALLFAAGGITPGPAVMLSVASSLRYGFTAGMTAGLGIVAANLLWVVLAGSGALALAALSPLLFVSLKFAGLAFIFVIACQMAFGPTKGLDTKSADAPRRSALFGKGVGLQLANPNALIFFAFMMPGFIDASKPILIQALIIAATVTVTELVGLATYSGLADRLRRYFGNPIFARWFFVCAALIMFGSAAFGVWQTS